MRSIHKLLSLLLVLLLPGKQKRKKEVQMQEEVTQKTGTENAWKSVG